MGYVAQHEEKNARKKLARGEPGRLDDSYSRKYKIRQKLNFAKERGHNTVTYFFTAKYFIFILYIFQTLKLRMDENIRNNK